MNGTRPTRRNRLQTADAMNGTRPTRRNLSPTADSMNAHPLTVP
jgi:hypothetical protein